MPIELGEKLGVLVNQAGYRRRVLKKFLHQSRKVTSSESKLQVDDTILYINEKYFSECINKGGLKRVCKDFSNQ